MLLAAFSVFAVTARRIISILKLGKAENRFDHWDKRVSNVLRIAIGQSMNLRPPVAGDGRHVRRGSSHCAGQDLNLHSLAATSPSS